MGVLEMKKLCSDAVRDALRSVGQWPLSRNPSPHDFTEEERFRMFRAVMHGHVWPVADIIRYEGRFAFCWTYSVWSCGPAHPTIRARVCNLRHALQVPALARTLPGRGIVRFHCRRIRMSP